MDPTQGKKCRQKFKLRRVIGNKNVDNVIFVSLMIMSDRRRFGQGTQFPAAGFMPFMQRSRGIDGQPGGIAKEGDIQSKVTKLEADKSERGGGRDSIVKRLPSVLYRRYELLQGIPVVEEAQSKSTETPPCVTG
jgi:hypothetical protein